MAGTRRAGWREKCAGKSWRRLVHAQLVPAPGSWLMHGVRAAIPQTNPLANAEFAAIRERLIKLARAASPIELPRAGAVPNRCAPSHAVRPMSHGATGPPAPAHLGRSTPNALHGESHHADQLVGVPPRPLNTRVKTHHVMHYCG
jgi:hypothetical protein